MKRLLTLIGLLTLCATLAFTQQSRTTGGTNGTPLSNLGTVVVPNVSGGTTASFELLYTGAPTTSTVTIQGCMRGGTCDLLDTYSGTTNIIRKPAISSTYDQFNISWTAFSGGTSPTLGVNVTIAPGTNPALTTLLADPCQDPNVPKSSAKITLSSTTVQEVIPAVAGQQIFICNYAATIQGSATTVGTLQFEYGTKTTNGCDTGTVTLNSPFQGNITANVPLFINGGAAITQFTPTPVSNEFCAVATGTTISINGTVTFVQR